MSKRERILLAAVIIVLVVLLIMFVHPTVTPPTVTPIDITRHQPCNGELLSTFNWTYNTELILRPFNDSTVVIYVHDGVIRSLGIVEVCVHLQQGTFTADYYLNSRGEHITMTDTNRTIQVTIYLP